MDLQETKTIPEELSTANSIDDDYYCDDYDGDYDHHQHQRHHFQHDCFHRKRI